jgi:hypothetical protein
MIGTQTVNLPHPETGEATWAWACGCDCPPHADMCTLQLEEDCDHAKAGDLLYCHSTCIAPRLSPVEA